MAPVRWGALAAFVTVFATLGVLDATRGIPIPAYFWALGAVTVLAVVIGGALRRTPWLLLLLLVPAAAGLVAFGGTRASLTDGSGDRLEVPHSAAELRRDYRMAFGSTTLDLTDLGTDLTRDRTLHVRLAAGRVRLVVPDGLATRIRGDVHLGAIEVDGRTTDATSGVGVSRDIVDRGTSDGRLTVDVDISAGLLQVVHQR